MRRLAAQYEVLSGQLRHAAAMIEEHEDPAQARTLAAKMVERFPILDTVPDDEPKER